MVMTKGQRTTYTYYRCGPAEIVIFTDSQVLWELATTAAAVAKGVNKFLFLNHTCWKSVQAESKLGFKKIPQNEKIHKRTFTSYQHMNSNQLIMSLTLNNDKMNNLTCFLFVFPRCWISNSTIFFATFFAPAILIVLINLVVFVIVMWVLANRHFDARRYTVGSKQRDISRGRREILGIISITALLGKYFLK